LSCSFGIEVWRQPVGNLIFKVVGFWVEAPIIGEDTYEVTRVVVLEDTHESPKWRIHKHEFIVDVAIAVERVRPFLKEIGEGAVPVVADRLLLAERVVLHDVSKYVVVLAQDLLDTVSMLKAKVMQATSLASASRSAYRWSVSLLSSSSRA
jgi:hypothetical protein